jgi:hypothetical protein
MTAAMNNSRTLSLDHIASKYFFVMLFTFLFLSVDAQKATKFNSQNFVGILEGNGGTRFQLQTINGLSWKTWFAGIGTGLDYHYFRSVPLFLSLNKSFCACERSWFISLDGGYNWVWDRSTGNNINGNRNGSFTPAPYWATGIGYKIGLKNKKDAVLLNIGFSAKHVRSEVPSYSWCTWQPCPESFDEFRYKLNRLSLRAGWQF